MGFDLLIVTPTRGYEIQQAESYISQYETSVRQLLFYVADPEMDDSRFEGRLRDFTENVKRIRAFWRDRGLEYLDEMGSTFATSEPQDPQSTTPDLPLRRPSPE
jgi:hypothetical protein